MTLRQSFTMILVIAMVSSMCIVPSVGAAPREVRVFLDGRQVQFPDTRPFIGSGRTFVPVRFVSEALGASVAWDEIMRRVTIVRSGQTIVLTMGMAQVLVNGASLTLDAPAHIVAGRAMVPLRFVSEVLGSGVEWRDQEHAVHITSQRVAIVNPGRREISFDPVRDVQSNGTMVETKAIEFGKRALDNVVFKRVGQDFYVQVEHVPGPIGFNVYVSSIAIWRGSRALWREGRGAPVFILHDGHLECMRVNFSKNLKLDSIDSLSVVMRVRIMPIGAYSDMAQELLLTYDTEPKQGTVFWRAFHWVRAENHNVVPYDFSRMFQW